MVYETGDNSSVQAGESEPLDLFYSRAENFGDDYVVWTETDTSSAGAKVCYPTDPHLNDDVSDVVVGSLNAGQTHSSEADLEGSQDRSKLHATWTQWVFEDDSEELAESEAMNRRVWWLDNFIPAEAWTLGGTDTAAAFSR